MKRPQPLRSILDKTLKSLELDVPLKTYSILGAWQEIVGDSIALQAQPRSIRNRILFVDVSHPTWMQQLQFLKPTLLEKTNHFLGEPLIRDIRFKLGKISPPAPTPPKALLLEDNKLDKTVLDRIEGALQGVSDDEVRKGLRDLLIKGATLERYQKKSR